MRLRQLFASTVIIGLGLSVSGCLTMGDQAWRGEYGTGGGEDATIIINTADYNTETAPKACVNDLEIYEAHLQAPEAVRTDLERPVSSYINQAGSARAALNEVNAEISNLEGALINEQAHRNTFNPSARANADASIEVLEDEVFLNRALAEAIECRV